MRWLSILLLFIPTFLSAQHYEFVQIGVNDGLSQNSVHDIYQDKKGFLWIATADGLNRYDGTQFKVYKHRYEDTSIYNIPSNFIVGDFFEDEEENLWFLTDMHLVKMDKKHNRFHIIKSKTRQEFYSAIKSMNAMFYHDGFIWLIIKYKHIIKIDPRTLTEEYIHLPKNTLYVNFSTEHEEMYAFTKETAYRFDFKQQQFQPSNIPTIALSFKRINDYQIVYQDGPSFYIFNSDNGSRTKISLDVYDNEGALFYVWKEKFLFVSVSGKGIFHYDLATHKYVQYKSVPGDMRTLSFNFIHKFYSDRSDNLWIGTEGGGLSKLNLKPQKFHAYPLGVSNTRNPANLMVKGIYAKGNKIYAGTFSRGLHIIDTATGEGKVVTDGFLNPYGNLSPITVVYADSKERIWMNAGNKIGYIDTVTGKFITQSEVSPDHIGFIYSLYEMAPDTFILGSGKQLHRFWVTSSGNVIMDHDSVYAHPRLKGLIQSIVKSSVGDYYIGSVENGFKRVQINGTQLNILDSGLTKTGVRHFYEDKKNQIIWIASDNGLIAYHPNTKTREVFDEEDGLSNNHVYAVLPESDDVIWISTNRGLNKIKYEITKDNTARLLSVKLFHQKSGLQSNEFNSGAYFAYDRDNMIFGGVTGVNWFNNKQVISNPVTPQVSLTGLMVNERIYKDTVDFSYLKKIVLPHNENSLYLRFAALEYTNPALNKYMYKMVGGENKWIESPNEVRFVQLAPGNYQLFVKASNSDEVWSDEVLLLTIEILPPFWQTWWFKLIGILLILTTVFFIVRYIIQRSVRSKTRELEMQQALNEERLRISRDMHDEMGTGLTKVALLAEVAKQKMKTQQSNSMQTLDDITLTSRGLIQKMGEIIWMLNPVNDTLDSLAVYLKEYVFNVTDTLQLDVITDFPENIPSIKLSHDKRRQLLLVTKEALHNSIKHAHATQITFSLDVTSQGFTFMMHDNGIGLNNVQSLKTGVGKNNGLKNMEWRMKQINGFFEIDSAPGEGTTIIYGMINGL